MLFHIFINSIKNIGYIYLFHGPLYTLEMSIMLLDTYYFTFMLLVVKDSLYYTLHLCIVMYCLFTELLHVAPRPWRKLFYPTAYGWKDNKDYFT